MADRMDDKKKHAGEGDEHVTRRDFMKATAGLAVAASLGTAGCRHTASNSVAAPAPTSLPDTAPEELVKYFHRTLTEKQKSAMCFDWNHGNRTKVS